MRRALSLIAALPVLLLPGTAAAVAEGPYRTVQRGYDLGRETLQVAGRDWRLHALPTRLAGEITAPVGAPGPRPVVVFLHGAHQSCEITGGFFPTQDWPCRPGFVDVPSYRGYRYAALVLASHGYVVVSLDGNPVAPANSTASTFPDGEPFTPRTWMDLRSKIVDAQLRRLVRAGAGETGAPVDFGVPLAGRVDASRVGLVGHSRGGEGVVWASTMPGPRPYRVAAVLALAPVDFFRRLVPDVPFGVVLPYCDYDVSDLQGAWFFDDARGLRRTQPLWQAVVFGANHNFFNRVWGDETGWSEFEQTDPCSPSRIGRTRLSRADQEAVAAEIAVRFLRGALEGDSELVRPLGIGAAPPRELAGAAVAISVQPPSADRLDVIRPAGRDGLRRNLLGGAQGGSRLDSFMVCTLDPGTILKPSWQGAGCGRMPPYQAFAGSELRLAWSREGARFETRIPTAHADVRALGSLSLRVAVDPTDRKRSRPGRPLPFTVVLRDASGGEASVPVPRFHPAVRYPTRGLAVLGEVRIPLAAFAGVDLGDVAAVELRFDRVASGRLLVSDLSFVR
ncbi:MAG: hypothetical protein IT201_08185 [Thermoleophilia bacterium]|nr:hypothetical protein [Thermoleophilia bacterium]